METYHGDVPTKADAIKLIQACRQGALPYVEGPLSDKAKQSIQPGSVFLRVGPVIQDWLDGKSWDSGRYSKEFQIFRQTKCMTGDENYDDKRGSDQDIRIASGDKSRYQDKLCTLMKKMISLTTSTGEQFHLICYYSQDQSSKFLTPTTDPTLESI
ncbi:hypothetical protein F5884DRAFT_623539, partial [Xylogone sp. PMI_703]